MREINRRDFLKMIPPAMAGVVAAAYLPEKILSFTFIEPIDSTINPLEVYPNRDWEKVYRDLYSSDYSFHYLCAPNDTHGCLLKAAVKNGVIKWLDPSFGYNKTTDMYGNTATSRWDPRICVSGLSYVRRFYSDRRIKGAFVRKGFKDWVDAGFPRDSTTGQASASYFSGRGKEDWVKVSYDDAYTLVAKTMINVAQTYSDLTDAKEGTNRLKAQGYDPAMVDTDHYSGAGTRTIKGRGGMPLLAPMRVGGLFRFFNMLALLDVYVRGVDSSHAKGGRGWDSYSWHTDLPPGHPMVCGNKTSEFDLYTAENANVITLWGMNWIATKMPEAHWLTEARLHGAKVITIATEYQSTSHKADEVIIIRPGTDAALALGLAQVIINEGLYDSTFVKKFTDLPLLVRMDTLKLLNAKDLNVSYTPAPLSNFIKVLSPGESIPSIDQQGVQYVTKEIRDDWGDFTVWDSNTSTVRVVTRDEVGDNFPSTVDPALTGEFTVTLGDGTTTVKVRSVFDLVKKYLDDNFTPNQTSEITWAPQEAITSLARLIADPANRGFVLFTTGMGPNHYYNADLKDRTVFLVASLTANQGNFGGEVGSYAGNYRVELFAMPYFFSEDPFNIELDSTKQAKVVSYTKSESAHYYNYGDRPLRIGGELFTGSTHMPTPTKVAWWANANSILGNSKWAYDVIMNTLPKIEMIVVNDWFWTATCEYSDVVFGVDSWPERSYPDIYASCTNPFLQAGVRTPLPRIFDTKDDLEVLAGVATKLSVLTGDNRFQDYWKFVEENKVEVYINRIFKAGNTTKGYLFENLEDSCRKGTPFYTATRTSPRIVGWEQTNESKPWYTKTGRLEFYRDENEWIKYGENLPVFRECSDSTYYEPFVIVGEPHPAINPTPPPTLASGDLKVEARQVNNVRKPWSEVKNTQHPLMPQGYTHILYTPKFRHAGHTTAASTDIEVAFWGPFGDFYRRDKRTPWVGEGYVDMNPLDAKELGIEDGDYIWVEADPEDRPFRGWKDKPEGDTDRKVTKWLVRARYYPNITRKTARAWFHFYISTHGSVEGHESRADGLAKNPKTGYQAAYRYGSHQSITRAWLRTTTMTDSLVRKDFYGQRIGKGFETDIHCPVGAPKESFVKISRAEAGGIGGIGLYHPASKGFRPTYENDAVKKYLKGEYITVA